MTTDNNRSLYADCRKFIIAVFYLLLYAAWGVFVPIMILVGVGFDFFDNDPGLFRIACEIFTFLTLFCSVLGIVRGMTTEEYTQKMFGRSKW